ncbi:MAG: hypothetical protein WA786_05865 [Acidimicrobiales bacterium]
MYDYAGSQVARRRGFDAERLITPRPRTSAGWRLVRLAGGGLVVATGAIHLDLYLTGYRTIPTIGWMFLVQVISAFLLAAAVTVADGRVVSAVGAGFLMATLVGYLWSLWIGLFGFREVRTAAGVMAAVIEVVGFVALATFALRPYRYRLTTASSPLLRTSFFNPGLLLRTARWVVAVVAVQAVVASAILLASNSTVTTSPGAPSVVVKVARIHGVPVLTNAHGFTLYWFAPDSPAKSACYSTCAAYWPPLLGVATPGAGVVGTFGSLRRSRGATQVTYDHHPLYTYIGDSSPGQASGNRVKLNGGWWYEMKMSG